MGRFLDGSSRRLDNPGHAPWADVSMARGGRVGVVTARRVHGATVGAPGRMCPADCGVPTCPGVRHLSRSLVS